MSAATNTSYRQCCTHTRTRPLGFEIIKVGEPHSRLSTCPLKRGARERARTCRVSDGAAARSADRYAAARITLPTTLGRSRNAHEGAGKPQRRLEATSTAGG